MANGSLEGRVAVVTGANRNIGAAIAIRLGRQGARVVVNHPDPQTAADAEQVAKTIGTGSAIAVAADVSDEQAVRAMVTRATEALGAPDILVNNAAIDVARQEPWDTDDAAHWMDVLRVNVVGAYVCARAIVPGMIENGGGTIVNISSITAFLGYTGNLPYVTSKTALLGMTRSLARELGPARIRVNAVLPGAIPTPQQAALEGTDMDPKIVGGQALEREGAPEDIASAVAYLVSDEGSFITGQSIVVDGGWTMH